MLDLDGLRKTLNLRQRTLAVPLLPKPPIALEIKEIKQIIELMNQNDLSLFLLERDGVKIKLKKGADLDAMLESLNRQSPSGPADEPPPQATQALPAPAEPVEEVPGHVISAPTVGTFYRKPEPDKPSFVKVGDRVDEDTVVCIIEAMKVMNEIKAETKGVIKRAVAEDGKPVQYGDPLFELELL